MTLPDMLVDIRGRTSREIYLVGKNGNHKCLDFFRTHAHGGQEEAYVAYIESQPEPEEFYEARVVQRGSADETYYLKVLTFETDKTVGNNVYILTMTPMSNVERLVRGFVK
jgi:hypothetical protein